MRMAASIRPASATRSASWVKVMIPKCPGSAQCKA